jgi:hypothetical protein
MRLTSKNTVNTNSYRPQYFSVKKDRKSGLVLTSPVIDWKVLTDEQKRIQWVYCTNYLWECEKEGVISKENMIPAFHKILELLKISKQDLYYINLLKDWEIPSTVLTHSFYLGKSIRELISKGKSVANNSTAVTKVEKVSIKDPYHSILIDEIQGYEDNIFESKINWEQWIKDRNVNKEISQKILKFFIPRLKELIILLKKQDEQVIEAYRKFSTKQINYMSGITT